MLDKVAHSRQLGSSRSAETVEASLHFSRGGGRTVLWRQRVPYPFHVTRPFHLDRQRPDLATLYLQSASGGLYRGDRVSLSIIADAHTAVHVTTQASTIVHRTYSSAIAQHTSIDIGEHAFVAMTPDPLVLFPGAEISCSTDVTIAATGNAILIDGFAQHDAEGRRNAFDRYSSAIIVRDRTSGILVHDRGSVAGKLVGSAESPLGPFRAVGTLMVLGERARCIDLEALEVCLAGVGCTAGMSSLPADAGIGGRILAADGGALARGLEAAFAVAFVACVGAPPARRRK